MTVTATTILDPASWTPPVPGQSLPWRLAVVGSDKAVSAWVGDPSAWRSLTRFGDVSEFAAKADPAAGAQFDAVVDEGGGPVEERIEVMLRSLDVLAPGGLYVGLNPAACPVSETDRALASRHESLLDAAFAVALDISNAARPVRAVGAGAAGAVCDAVSSDFVQRSLRQSIGRLEFGARMLRIVKAGGAAAASPTLHPGDISRGPLASRVGEGSLEAIQQDQMAALAAETSRLRLQLRRMQANNAAWAERVRLMESSWPTASVQLVSRRTWILRIPRTLAFRAARRCYHVALRIPLLRRLAMKARAFMFSSG
jgi:hypothetical protein